MVNFRRGFVRTVLVVHALITLLPFPHELLAIVFRSTALFVKAPLVSELWIVTRCEKVQSGWARCLLWCVDVCCVLWCYGGLLLCRVLWMFATVRDVLVEKNQSCLDLN